MPPSLTIILGSLSVVTLLLFYFATSDISENLSPQGCRMSWMSPSYILQNDFNTSWTPLARRYSLSLYREVGWDPNQVQGTPVLFIPGNAGSSHQVRSIASSATRQFYTSPYVVAPEFSARTLKPLDFFAVEFNEDLSAFHGPTLDSQIAYTSRAITYILSLYPPNTSIIIMGHSMGGLVATSLLPSLDISAIITMSTPHVLPPARFDSRIDKIYRHNRQVLDSDPTPILSLCGGATDMMIPSESCILPTDRQGDVFRRTVFTSALEGAWTGVGHREMVWCHQVRWRIARAALEIGAADSPGTRGDILDTWLRDGHTLPPAMSRKTASGKPAPEKIAFENVAEGTNLLLHGPRGSRTYLLHVPSTAPPTSALKAVILVGLGSIPPVSPQEPAPLRVSVYLCASSPASQEAAPRCKPLEPSLLKLVPNPMPEKVFPVPEEGSGESEGSVIFEGDIPPLDDEGVEKRWIAVRVEDGNGRGWVAGAFSREDEVIDTHSTFSLLFGRVNVVFPDAKALRTHFVFPNIISNALIVYRYTPTRPIEKSWCSDPLLAPLIMHTSHPSETHYYPVNVPNRGILLHTHSPAPYIPLDQSARHRTLSFTIYASSLGCNMLGFEISIDWSATLGRWATRYPTTLISWAVGVVAIVLFTAWGVSDRDGAMPTVQQSLATYSRYTLRKLLFVSLLVAILPLPVDYYLGTGGELFFAPIAPLLLVTASGLVCISWWVLSALMWPVGLLWALIFGRPRRREEFGVRRSTIVSMGFIFALIFLLVPWQVAYLGCWLIHLFTCASSARHMAILKPAPTPGGASIPLIRVTGTDDIHEDKPAEIQNHESQPGPIQNYKIDNHNHSIHLLLLMTWLLPLVAPVLAVWVRTLATAGLTTPFDGDHDFLNVAPFLVLVDFASWNTGILFERQRFERTLSVRWCLAVLAGTAFFVGPRRAYGVFDAAKIAVALIVVIRVGRRYWGGAAWSVDGNKVVP